MSEGDDGDANSLDSFSLCGFLGPVGDLTLGREGTSLASDPQIDNRGTLTVSFPVIYDRGCHIRGCPCVSVCVCVRPSAYTGRLWLSISTHISTLVLGLSTLTLPVDCSGDFGPHGLSASKHRTSVGVRQHTQDVRLCPSAHTGRPWLSISTHISTFVPGLSTLTLSGDCSGDFGPRGLSVQYTHDVRGCPSAHTGRPCVSVSTHRTSVAVHQYTYQHVRPWTQHADPSSVGVRQHTQDVCGCPTHISTLVLGLSTLALPVDCLGDLGHGGLPVQYTQDVRGCPSAHIGRLCVSVSTHRTFVAVHQYTYQHVGPWTQHADPSHGLFG
ncbi:hypothetical protein YC2023_066307 [Brassica napus]